jgi:catabolite regulation protein CreA
MPSIFEATADKALGYVKGGAVTQATSKATAVTLNQPCGQITMNNAALAAAAEVSFTVTNSFATAGDVVIVNHGSAGTAGAYLVQANLIADGSFKITVSNVSTASKSEAIVLNYAIIKAAAA